MLLQTNLSKVADSCKLVLRGWLEQGSNTKSLKN